MIKFETKRYTVSEENGIWFGKEKEHKVSIFLLTEINIYLFSGKN